MPLIRTMCLALAMQSGFSCLHPAAATPPLWSISVVAGNLNLRGSAESRYGTINSLGLRSAIDFEHRTGLLVGFQYGEASGCQEYQIRSTALELGLRLRLDHNTNLHFYAGALIRAYSVDEWIPPSECSSWYEPGWRLSLRRATHILACSEWHPRPTGMALGVELSHIGDALRPPRSDLSGFEIRCLLSYCRYRPQSS